MTKPILSISAKGALYNAVSDAEETYLETVRDNHFRGDRPTPTELYHKGIYCALYGLVCRFGLESDYLDWHDENENEDDEEEST